MEEIAIRINSLSKIYKLYDRPIDRLKETLSPRHKSYHKDFYALNDISLTIKKGETVGIIGKNGAGKSTLLKIITGVLSPSAGSVEINGRISSLLELGAGFNPEYTGIENIYLNGTIMGLSKEETDARLDDILAFADIGDFAYQPVKTYSSGMYVRLAFSVAINVKPDILIVDEALAVGDARFQLKCFKKLTQLKETDVTILFVSHSIEQIRSFCSKGILINEGKIIFEGDPKETGVKYFDLIFPPMKRSLSKKTDLERSHTQDNNINEFHLYPEQALGSKIFGKGGAKIDLIKIIGTNGKNIITGGENLILFVQYSWNRELVDVQQRENLVTNDIGISIALANEKGEYIFGCNNFDFGLMIDYTKSTQANVKFSLKLPYLKSGTYFLTAAIALGEQKSHVQLRWYDYFAELKCVSRKKNVYGIMALDYTLERI